jgi:hypothetical protein
VKTHPAARPDALASFLSVFVCQARQLLDLEPTVIFWQFNFTIVISYHFPHVVNGFYNLLLGNLLIRSALRTQALADFRRIAVSQNG